MESLYPRGANSPLKHDWVTASSATGRGYVCKVCGVASFSAQGMGSCTGVVVQPVVGTPEVRASA